MDISEEAINTFNEFMVAVQGDQVRVMRPPVGLISKEQTWRLAAWQVAVTAYSREDRAKFDAVLAAVLET